jgi:hypothetical protein
MCGENEAVADRLEMPPVDSEAGIGNRAEKILVGNPGEGDELTAVPRDGR